MKKLLYTTLVIIILASTASAQSDKYKSKKYFGFNFGYGFSGAMFQPNMNQEMYTGSYTGGIAFKYRGEKYMAFQGEIDYSHKGYRIKNDTIAYERTSNTIMVPMMAQGNIGYKRLNVILNLGCYGSYMLNAKEKTTYKNVTTENDYDIKLVRDHRYEFGIVAGGGFYVDLKPVLVQFEARYYYGLTNLIDPTYTNNRPLDSRQYQFVVSGGLFFDLGSIFAREPKQTKK